MEGKEFSDLPEYLVFDIFLRLPVKSLKRLSCVNKSWCSLIRSSSFISQHYLYHSSATSKLLIRHHRLGIPTRKIVFSLLSKGDNDDHLKSITSPFEERIYLSVTAPSINGIICVRDGGGFIALWNPTTGECKRLPRCNLSHPHSLDPVVQALGFGWVSETNDYKVVMVMGFWPLLDSYDRMPSQIFLYSLSTDCWKKLSPASCDAYIDCGSPSCHVYINGACHWLSSQIVGIFIIISFDMRDEVFRSIQLPNFENTPFRAPPTLSVLDGCIALAVLQDEGRDPYFNIWVMTEYGVQESWIRKFKIGPLFDINGLGFGKDGEFFMEHNNGDILLYDLKSQELRSLGIRGLRYDNQVLPYVESLVPLSRR